MNYEEFKKILIAIESNYPKFKLEDYQIKFWWEKLKDYEYIDILRKFQQHLDGELNYTYPTLNFLIKNLLTHENKISQKKIFVLCPFCGKKYEYPNNFSNWKKCHERCSMINNILIKSEKFKIDSYEIFGGDVNQLKLSDIDKNYVKFLKKVYEKMSKNFDSEINNKNFSSTFDLMDKNAIKKILETIPQNNQQMELNYE